MVTPSTGNFDTQRFEGLLSKLKGTAQKSRYASSREQRPGSYGTTVNSALAATKHLFV